MATDVDVDIENVSVFLEVGLDEFVVGLPLELVGVEG